MLNINKQINLKNQYREDLHQIITYMHILNSKSGILIYPDSSSNNDKNNGTLKGYGGEIYKYSFNVVNNNESSVSNFKTYITEMIKREDLFIYNVEKIVT